MNTRGGNRKGFVLIMLALSMGTLLLAAGLAVDAGVLFLIKARLTSACDAASLAAARNLNLGTNWSTQVDAAKLRAESFFYADFPRQFLGATRSAPVITVPANVPTDRILTITTRASAVTGTYFMRYFGWPDVTVNAEGTASRRAVNIILVLDRSLSMKNSSSCGPMKTAAANFVQKFVDSRDNLGIITFGTDYVEALDLVSNFKSGNPTASSVISSIDCAGKTSVTTAYWRAYQKLVERGQQNALNVIVLFTDGAPNGFYGTFTKKSGSPCQNATMDGVMAEGQISGARGLFKVLGNDPDRGDEAFVSNPNCKFLSGQDNVNQDIEVFPTTDLFGNRPTNYASDVHLPGDYKSFSSGEFTNSKIEIVPGTTNEKVSINILDHAAARTRLRRQPVSPYSTADYQHPVGVVTYVIGLAVNPTGSDQPDPILMSRVANQKLLHNSTTPNPAYLRGDRTPDGLYEQSNANGDLGSAFDRIAAEVLRISR